MAVIYLDYNILMKLMDGCLPKVSEKIEELRSSKKVIFPYSPAHIEEISVSKLHGKASDEMILEKLGFIDRFTEQMELHPARGRPTRLLKEASLECYKRVVAAPNDYLHDLEESRLREFSEHEGKTFTANVSTNIPYDRVFDNEDVRSAFRGFMLKRVRNEAFHKVDSFREQASFPSLRWRHEDVEVIFELLFNFMETIRYSPEPVKKYRSRMHDISHSIYGSAADVIVTDDRRFLRKLRTVYYFLSVGSLALHTDEFLSHEALHLLQDHSSFI
ncbi:hypothetical protein [Azospirillum doebereinerae]|uniref:PIN domain-containing protein n=1 Tax=Azospirillum doebereinerae TaxID=92933 RepID=A0A433J597_9PROT|nr:hypothetical protein [Azospirillum doebereinerae]RUQ67583.1 hypothetical protein EJ913_20400 [Azospirillum doebereinerae]